MKRSAGGGGRRRSTSNPPDAAAERSERVEVLEAELKAARRTIDVLIARTERRALEPSQAELFEVAARMEQQIERRTRELEEKRSELEAVTSNLDQIVRQRTRALAESEAQLLRKNAELERQSQLKAEFISIVAHELRTPLVSIVGYLDLLVEGKFGPLEDAQERPVASLKRNAHRLKRLVDEMLDFSRLEAGRARLTRTAINLAEVASDAITELKPLADRKRGIREAFRRRHRLFGHVALYGGRIDPGKGCEELFEYFATYRDAGGDATLALMGAKLMPLPETSWLRFAGMLPEAERLQALDAADVVVVPSPLESLSLLALEAMAMGTPVLCNARAEVLVEHCRRSNAGLYYADRDEFVEALSLLMADDRLRTAMGRNGRDYVQAHYRWEVILGKYDRLISGLTAGGSSVPRASSSAAR